VHVFVLTDKEEAAYFINDLEALRGKDKDLRNAKKDEDMLFYPAPRVHLTTRMVTTMVNA
jgi:hypothetical protein